jgi:hypothetical protein
MNKRINSENTGGYEMSTRQMAARRVAKNAIHFPPAARGSGRVGRSAAGRARDEEAVRLAVVASVRHQDTPYDELLMSGVDRADARDRVQDKVDAVLEMWARRAEG